MCSIVEEDFGDDGGVHAMIEDTKISEIADEVCKKCNVEKSVIKLVFKESQSTHSHGITDSGAFPKKISTGSQNIFLLLFQKFIFT